MTGRLFIPVCALGWNFLAAPASAQEEERTVQIRIGTVGPTPTQICIASKYNRDEAGLKRAPTYRGGPDKDSCVWSPIQRQEACERDPNTGDAEQGGACKTTVPSLTDTVLWCSEPEKIGLSRLAVLRVDGGIHHVAISHSIVTLKVRATRFQGQSGIGAEVIGGDYQGASGVSHREPDNSDRLDLTLVPQCESVRVVVPRYECPSRLREPFLSVRYPSQTAQDAGIKFRRLSDQFDISLPVSLQSAGVLSLSDCDGAIELEASWSNRPPAIIQLKPKKFPVRWRRDALAPPQCPARMLLPEAALCCPLIDSHAFADNNQSTATAKTLKNDEKDSLGRVFCSYTCSSTVPIDLPTTASFHQVNGSGDDVTCDTPTNESVDGAAHYDEWDLKLVRPGDTLDGYVRPEGRYILLDRSKWANRTERIGDKIEWIELATPDGRVQIVAIKTQRLFVPGLHYGDSVTYRYLGSRPFKQTTSPVQSGGKVELEEPDTLHARAVQPGLSVWVGWRHAGGGGHSTTWNSAGGGDLALAIPHWRVYASENWYIEPELHFGLTVTTLAYESVFQATPDSLPKDRWDNVSSFLLPMEVTVRMPFPNFDSIQFNLGGGATYYHSVYAADERRVVARFAGSLRASAYWKLTPAVAFGLDVRGLLGSYRRIERFDIGGLRQQESQAWANVFMFGPMVRFDDVF